MSGSNARPPEMRLPTRRLRALLVLLLVLAGASLPSSPSDGRVSAAPAVIRPWSTVKSWTYWLDRPDLAQIGASAFELAVIDYSSDRTVAGEFTAAQIDALRSGQCSRRVLAYISVGQAENYRFYWQPGWRTGNPSWIGDVDPDRPTDFSVELANPAWREIMERYLDRVIAQGFDGVYLDRIDSYADTPTGPQDMLALVRGMATYARARSPLGEDFGVFVQNEPHFSADLVPVLTGIGNEAAYFAPMDQVTTGSWRNASEAGLDVIRDGSRGHLVLTVDYASNPANVAEAYNRARGRGYVPYVTDEPLNGMRINAGFEPTCTPLVTPTPTATSTPLVTSTPFPTSTPNPGLKWKVYVPLVMRNA
jgi:cysteinyl-tRNA synthetase, unknown class